MPCRADRRGNARVSTAFADASAKKLPTIAVTAGISITLPTRMPSPAAIESIQDSIVTGACICGPSVVSIEVPPSPSR